MYKTDQAIISRYAQSGPDAFGRTMQFVILTIQTRLANVPADFDTAEQGGEEAMGVLYGYKHQAYVEAWEHRERHYAFAQEAARHTDNPHDLTCVLIEYFADLVGFGPPKAGFLVQLVYTGLGGCLDTHNIKRYGLSPRAFGHYKQLKTTKARRRHVAKYVTLCTKLGGAEALWDNWCRGVADSQSAWYKSPDHVSEMHCKALGLPVGEPRLERE